VRWEGLGRRPFAPTLLLLAATEIGTQRRGAARLPRGLGGASRLRQARLRFLLVFHAEDVKRPRADVNLPGAHRARALLDFRAAHRSVYTDLAGGGRITLAVVPALAVVRGPGWMVLTRRAAV